MRKDPLGFPIEEDKPHQDRRNNDPRDLQGGGKGGLRDLQGGGTGGLRDLQEGSLPGDFSFKVTHEPATYDEEKIPLKWAVGGLLGGGLWSGFLLFGSWDLNFKIQLFALSLLVGALVYNSRMYGIFGFGPSVLDAYVVPVAEDEEFRGEPTRISKWFRLVFSFAEAPVPEAEGEMHQEQVEQRERKATLRGFVEWMILILGFGWSFERTIAYAAPDGPYFYEIFAVHCVMLMVGVLFWGVMWLFLRQDDDWYRRRQHTEALNFLICRWCLVFFGSWFVVLLFALD